MKTRKIKTIFLALILMIALVVTGISAYFIDTDVKTNTFEIGNVSIKLMEPSWEEPTNIAPNQIFQKDPLVLNNGKNDAYVYLEVMVPCANVVIKTNDDGTPLVQKEELFTYTTNNGWVEIDVAEDENNNVVKHVYAYVDGESLNPLEPDVETAPLFNEIQFINITSNQGLEGTSLDVVVNAYAIQTDIAEDDVSADGVWNIVKESPIKKNFIVAAHNQYGDKLDASATLIEGRLADMLLKELESSELVNREDVSLLLDVEMEYFHDSATATFDVSSVATAGDLVVIYHYDETEEKWEYVTTATVNKELKVVGEFTSFSPVALVVEENSEAILLPGQDFNNLIPAEIRNIEFLNTAAPENATIDVSAAQNGSAMAWIEGETYYIAPKEAGKTLYANPNASCMFDCSGFDGEDYYLGREIDKLDVRNLDTSKVTNMKAMFRYLNTCANDYNCVVLGLEDLDVSNVTNMHMTFYNTLSYVQDKVALDLSKWDVSNVTYMGDTFSSFAHNADEVLLTGLGKWDVSNVTDMTGMFSRFAFWANDWSLDLSGWGNKTGNVTDMYSMFNRAGQAASDSFYLNLTGWDVSKVTDMAHMFTDAGKDAPTFILLGLEDWDTCNVTTLSSTFSGMGKHASSIDLDFSTWDTSKVKTMFEVFHQVGYVASDWSIGDLSTKEVTKNGKTYTAWDTSNVTSMWGTFDGAGYYANSWSIGNIGNWNTSKVKEMRHMFYEAGYRQLTEPLDLSSWDVTNVANRHYEFISDFYYINITPPKFTDWN